MQQQSPSSKRRGVSKHLAAVGGLALAATALAFGCAKGSVDFSGPGGGGNASTSSGGATGGGGNGGGTPIGPCGVDCASIKVAHCQGRRLLRGREVLHDARYLSGRCVRRRATEHLRKRSAAVQRDGM
jgi:hypothetical protein